jgi:molybdopterin synthase sulfur carrier subunit
MRVYIPTPLRSYTRGLGEVNLQAGSVGNLLREMDRNYPGMRFRVIDEQDCLRPHIKIYVNSEQVRSLDTVLSESDEVHIICALSGG